MKAMVAIGSLLLADQACSVYLCPMPKPGAVSDGWDIADAIAQGWSAEDVRAFIRGAHVFTSPNEAAEAKARADRSLALRMTMSRTRGGQS
jgi:putative DNA primase/helicase